MDKQLFRDQSQLQQFIQTQVEQQDTFALLDGLCRALRTEKSLPSSQVFYQLLTILKKSPDLSQQLAAQLCRWLCGQRLYPLFISCGILGREGFGREMRARLYEKLNPAFKNANDLRDVFFLLFNHENDVAWLSEIPLQQWEMLLNWLRHHSSEHDRQTLENHLRYEGLFAIEMLAIWIAAEEMEPELIRLEPALLDVDSSFIALQREVTLWIDAQRRQADFDDSHLQVMFAQSVEMVERLQKRGAAQGSSLNVAHLLERLSQTLLRLASLMNIFNNRRFLPRRMLHLVGELAIASANQHSVTKLWKQSVRMLSRTITQNTSDHGEHYITRSRKEYFSMFYSAAGGGILIALMALFKIYLGGQIDDKVWKGVAEGLNYGLGFMLIFMLHFTVATKQPAMTASRFAEAVQKNPQGRSVNMQLAQLLIDVCRSQSIAVLGNVLTAVGLAALIAWGYAHYYDQPLLDSATIAYQLASIDPTKGTLWFAAIAGVWLFCAGIISGYFDNRCNYLNLRMRLREHPLLKRLLPTTARERVADYLHNNYGAIMGNLCFGMLLGLTGVVGYLTSLPLDIRHIAFSSANVGYAVISGDLTTAIFCQSLGFVLLIGLVNLIVSFSLTLFVALRALGAEIDSWRAIAKSLWQLIKQRPMSLIFPPKER